MAHLIFISGTGAGITLILLAALVLLGDPVQLKGLAGPFVDTRTVDRWSIALGLLLTGGALGTLGLLATGRGDGDRDPGP